MRRSPTACHGGPVLAAAILARDGRFGVRVVLPAWALDSAAAAQCAAEQAGVDVAIESAPAGATVHFIGRHQDRRVGDWHGYCANPGMDTQVDYEAEVLLAVFRSAPAAAEAERALRAAGIDSGQSPLAPGRYQLADVRLRRRFGAGIGAAIVGALIGAVLGAAIGLWLFGTSVNVVVWLAVAGAAGGAIVGPLFGIARAARYDDDVARTLDVAPDTSAVIVRTHTPAAGTRGSARDILERAGAVAFLDIPTYEATLRGSTKPNVVESTSAGDPAGFQQSPQFGEVQVPSQPDENPEHHRPAA